MMKKKVMFVAVIVALLAGSALAQPAEPYRLAFVTLPVYQAVETDITVYNGWLQDEADAAGIGMGSGLGDGDTSWFLLGSTMDVDARDNTSTNINIQGAGVPIYLTDMVTKVADDNFDLWDGDIDHIINTLATGVVTPGHLWAYTGSSAAMDGTAGKDGAQGSNAGGPIGNGGETIQGNGGDVTTWAWRQWTSDPATTSLPIYAISEIIPEPATMCLLGFGGLALLRRRK